MKSGFIIHQEPVRLDTATASEPEQEFRAFLESNLFGQPDAITAGCDAYVASLSPIKGLNRPLYVVHSLGKSRTGKSELPRLLAQFLHGDRNALVRVNLSQYKSSHQISSLIGAPHSYVGFDSPAKFSRVTLEASRGQSKNGTIIVVLEEGEKAHEDVMDVLLGVLDNGEAELANGETVNFRDVIIFITSNLAADRLARLGKVSLGFQPPGEPKKVSQAEVVSEVNKALAGHYRPEFLNRIDCTIVYRDLCRDDVAKIVDREIRAFQKSMVEALGEKSLFVFSVDESAQLFLLNSAMKAAGEFDQNTDGSGSAVAELKRLIQRELIMPLNRELLKRTIGHGDHVTAVCEDGGNRLTLLNSKAPKLEQGEAAAAVADESAAAGESKRGRVAVQQDVTGKKRARGRNRRRYARGVRQPAVIHFHAANERELDEVSAQLQEMLSDENMFERINVNVDYEEGTFHAHVVSTAENLLELKDAFDDDVFIELMPITL